MLVCGDDCEWVEDFRNYKGIIEERSGKEYDVMDPMKYT